MAEPTYDEAKMEALLAQAEGTASAVAPDADYDEVKMASLLEKAEAAEPAFTPAAESSAAAAVASVSDQMVSERNLVDAVLTPNFSVIEDFYPKIQAAAKSAVESTKLAATVRGKLGLDKERLSTIFRSDDLLAHASSAGLGDVWSVDANPAAKAEWWRAARSREEAFTKAKGYEETATPAQRAELQSAFLFGELAWRTPMTEKTLGEASQHGLRSLVEQRRQLAGEHGEVTEEFTNAAAYLHTLSPDEAVQMRSYAAWESRRTPQNEQEALLIKSSDKREYGSERTERGMGNVVNWHWDSAGMGNPSGERFPSRAMSAMNTILGTRRSGANFLNHLDETDRAFKARDLGFIAGDLSRPGVRIPDPRAPGGFLDIDMVPPDTLVALERQKNASGVVSPFDVPVTPQSILGVQQATGADRDEAQQIAEHSSAVEGARAAQMSAGMGGDRQVGAETFTAVEWAGLSPLGRFKERMGEVMGQSFEAVVARPIQAWRDAQKGGVGEELAFKAVYVWSGDLDLAASADDLFDAATIGYNLVSQYLNIGNINAKQAATFERMEIEGRLGPTSALTRVVSQSSSLTDLDPDLEVDIFRRVTSATYQFANAKMWEDTRQLEEVRQARMSTAERVGYSAEYGRSDYAFDLLSSGVFTVFDGTGRTIAQAIDNPEYIPFLIGAERLGDFAVGAALGRIKAGIEGGLAAQNALTSMKKILHEAPHEVAALRRMASNQVAEAKRMGDQDAGVKALQDLEVHAKVLEKEWEGVRQGGVAPTRGDSARVATLWKQAADLGADFEGLAGMVQLMQPRGLLPQLGAVFREKVGWPAYLNADGLRGLSLSYQNLANRLNHSLGRAPTDILEATELEKGIGEATDPAVKAKLETQLAGLQGGAAHRLGLATRLERLAELDGMVDNLKAGRGADNARFQQIRTELWGEGDMADIDYATLVHLDDAKRWKPDGPVGRFLNKMTGKTPDMLAQIKSAGRRVLDFAVKDAVDLYTAKSRAGLGHMRTNKVYQFAKERVRQQLGVLERAAVAGENVPSSHARALEARLVQLENEHRRATTSPVESGWDMDNQKLLFQDTVVGNSPVMSGVTDLDLATLAELDPVMFGGVTRADFYTKNMLGDNVVVGDQQVALRRLYSTPSLSKQLGQQKSLAVGEQLVAVQRTIRRLQSKAARLRKLGAAQSRLDPVVEAIDKARAVRVDLRKKVRRERIRAQEDIGEMQSDVSSEVAAKMIGAEANGLAASGMPVWALGRFMHELPKTVARRQALQMVKHADLHSELGELRRTLSPELNKQVDALLQSGRFTGTVLDYPEFKAKWDAAYPSGDATKLSNIDTFLHTAERFRAEVFDDMLKMGRIDPHLHKQMLDAGWIGHQYDLHETGRALNDAEVRSAKKNLSAERGTQKPGVEGKGLMFQRDTLRHRVRIREADGFIRSEKFPTEEHATAWVRREYGDAAAASIKGTNESGFKSGKTASGDEIVLAAPIGRAGLEVLGISTSTPEVMLRGLEDMIRDNHIHLLIDSLRPSGLVLTKLQHTSLFNKSKTGGRDVADQFHKLPNDTRRLGNLAGHYVHKTLFAELNSYSHNFEQFKGWIEAISEVYHEAGGTVPDELINKMSGSGPARLYRNMTTVMKNALIPHSLPTWIANATFNATLSHMVGGRIFAAANWPTWGIAIKEIWSTTPRTGPRNRVYLDCVEDGLLGGHILGDDIHAPAARSALRALGLDNPDTVRRNIAKYERLSKEYEDGLKDGISPKHLDTIKGHLVGLRKTLDHYEAHMGKRIMRQIGGMLLANKNLLGLPNSEFMAELKASYGAVDDLFKFVNYYNLRKQGMSRAKATWEIKQHFQDYANVSPFVTAMSRNPLGALVPSFPLELVRISKNLVKNKPLKLMALMSMIPALNTLSALAAGVDENQVEAALGQAGHKNKWERFKANFLELRTWNSETKEVGQTISLLNFLPFMGATEGRGLLAQTAEHLFPEEDRTLWSGAAAQTLEFASNIFLNNFMANGAGTLWANKDTLTGQKILDVERGSKTDWLKAGWKHFGRQFVPKPFHIAEDFAKSLSAPVDQQTGKPVNAPHWTEVMTANLAVRTKGIQDLWYAKGKAQGKKLGYDEVRVKSAMYAVLEQRGEGWQGHPQFGPEADERYYTAALDDPATTDQQRREYEGEIKKLRHKEREVSMLGSKYKLSSTERQDWLAMERLEQRGVPDQFVQATPEEQALIMVRSDQAGVRSETIATLINLALRSQATGRLLPERDPESLQKAIAVITKRMGEPGSDKQLGALVQHWSGIQGRASGMRRREEQKAEKARGRR